MKLTREEEQKVQDIRKKTGCTTAAARTRVILEKLGEDYVALEPINLLVRLKEIEQRLDGVIP